MRSRRRSPRSPKRAATPGRTPLTSPIPGSVRPAVDAAAKELGRPSLVFDCAGIDAAVHDDVPSTKVLFPYLPPYWVEHVQNTMFKGPTEFYYPPTSPIAARPGSRPEGAGSTLSPTEGQARFESCHGPSGGFRPRTVSRQVIEEPHVDVAVLCSAYPVDSLHNPTPPSRSPAPSTTGRSRSGWTKSRASGVHRGADPDARPGDPRDRARRRPPGLRPGRPADPHRSIRWAAGIYHRVWEAIARNNLVAGLQFGGVPGNPPTPSGWPSYFFEEYVDMAGVFATPGHQHRLRGRLRPVPDAEGGAARVRFHLAAGPHVALRQGVEEPASAGPVGQAPPSEYIREHFRLTVQPLDAPGRPEAAARGRRSARLGRHADVRQPLPARARRRSEDDADPAPARDVARKIRSENARSAVWL